MLSTRDAGFLTEPQMWERIGTRTTPFELARDDQRYPLARLLDAADLVGRPDAVPRQIKLLAEADDGLRYWVAVGLRAAGPDAAPAREALRKALQDESAVVRIEAAATLVQLGESERALRILESDLRSRQPEVALHAARALELLGAAARPALPTMRAVLAEAGKPAKQDGWMFVAFSLEAALENLEAK
jgi:HEAT repeat protein